MGNNIKDLDALHQVMKGDMTVDQVCEGMTDDFEIGHVSHRADGDYRKVAQGKWVPVKAGGQGQIAKGGGEKKETSLFSANPTKVDVASIKEGSTFTGPNGGVVKIEKITDEGIKVISTTKNDDPKSFEIKSPGGSHPKYMANLLSILGYNSEISNSAEGAKPAEQQGGDKETGNAPQFKMGDKVRIKKEFLNPGESQREYSIANINEGTGRAYVKAEGTGLKLAPQELVGMNMLERVPENEPAPEEKPAEQKGGGANSAYKTFEENYAEATFGNNEAEKMGWKMADVGAYPFWDSPDGKYRISAQHTAKEGGFEYELREKDTGRTIGRYPSLLDALRKKTTDSAPARLTRDTKIRLSRIKREQTEDKKYNVGEISQKTGLQKQQDGSWAPPKQGRGSAYQESDKKVEALRGRGFNRTQLKNMRTSELDKLYESEIGAGAGGKKTFEGSGSTKGHKWEAEKVGDKYISTHTWPDGRTDKTEITQKDYETMRTTQGGKSEAPKPASSQPSSELKYYEDMGDRVEELRSQMTTAGPEEKRRLIRESVDLQRRMQTAPFRPKKKR